MTISLIESVSIEKMRAAAVHAMIPIIAITNNMSYYVKV